MIINFHILQSNSKINLIDFVINKIINEYSINIKLCILAPSKICKIIDNKLWNDNTNVFLPHYYPSISNEYNKFPKIPILITDNPFIIDNADKVINLMNIPINNIFKIKIIDEISNQQEEMIKNLRKKFKYYNKLKYNTKVFKTLK